MMRSGLGGLSLVLVMAPLLCLSACNPTDPLSIDFEARINSEAFSCGQTYSILGTELRPRDLRLFVSNFQLIRGDGSTETLRLDADGRFTTKTTALLDFEDGSGSCSNGNELLNTRVQGRVKRGSYERLRFDIGVPFAENHADPMRAEAPLTTTSMHWGWQGGYKFLRLDALTDSKPIKIHLGSTGCQGTIGHISACSNPNRAQVELPLKSPPATSVVFDFGRIIEQLLAVESPDCMGEADDAGCAPVFEGLGLSAASGTPQKPATLVVP